jgi:hypothetical protein
MSSITKSFRVKITDEVFKVYPATSDVSFELRRYFNYRPDDCFNHEYKNNKRNYSSTVIGSNRLNKIIIYFFHLDLIELSQIPDDYQIDVLTYPWNIPNDAIIPFEWAANGSLVKDFQGNWCQINSFVALNYF